MTALVIVLAVAVAVLGVLVFGLLRTHAEILRALDRAGVRLDDEADGSDAAGGPVPVGAPRPMGDGADIVGTIPGGGAVKVAVSGAAHTTLLAFLSSGCRSCQAFWETFADPDVVLPGEDTRLVIVAQDAAHDSESKLAELAPKGVKTVCSTAAWQDYDVPGSPYFALVDGPTGAVVGSGSASSWDQVSGLLGQALGDARPAGAGPSSATSAGVDASLLPGAEAAPGDTDEALRRAGIEPGDPSLWPDGRPLPQSDGTARAK